MTMKHVAFLGLCALSTACGNDSPCDPGNPDRAGGTATPGSLVRGNIQECEPPASWDVRVPPGHHRLVFQADRSLVGVDLLGDGVVWAQTGCDAGDPARCPFSEGGFFVATETPLKVRVSTLTFCEGAGGPLCTVYDYAFLIETME